MFTNSELLVVEGAAHSVSASPLYPEILKTFFTGGRFFRRWWPIGPISSKGYVLDRMMKSHSFPEVGWRSSYALTAGLVLDQQALVMGMFFA